MTPDPKRIARRHVNAAFDIATYIEEEKEKALKSIDGKIRRHLAKVITDTFKAQFPLWEMFDLDFDVYEESYERDRLAITASVRLKDDAFVRRYFKADRDEGDYADFMYVWGWHKEMKRMGEWLQSIGYSDISDIDYRHLLDPDDGTIRINIGRYPWLQ